MRVNRVNAPLTLLRDDEGMRFSISKLGLLIGSAALFAGCAFGAPSGQNAPTFQPYPGQGQYVRPDYLNPQPTPLLPALDPCQSQTFSPLLGVNEGAIYIPGLPGRKRIIRPAEQEDFASDFLGGEFDEPPLVEVEQYLPGQQLYAPSVRTLDNRLSIVPEDMRRLTIELDQEGYIQEIRCG